jgi:hypothetical protein
LGLMRGGNNGSCLGRDNPRVSCDASEKQSPFLSGYAEVPQMYHGRINPVACPVNPASFASWLTIRRQSWQLALRPTGPHRLCQGRPWRWSR